MENKLNQFSKDMTLALRPGHNAQGQGLTPTMLKPEILAMIVMPRINITGLDICRRGVFPTAQPQQLQFT